MPRAGVGAHAVDRPARQVFTLIAVAFRSLVVPVRAVLTISLSLVYCFGLAWVVYGRGALDGLGWAPLGRLGSITWSAPILSFPIMVGLGAPRPAAPTPAPGARSRVVTPPRARAQTRVLGLDYDVFLLGRVLEYRLQGSSERESIAAGLETSGPLITAAGLIMAIAFGALLFSTSVSLNELAFLLTISVLVDTLVVRTVLVPSVMGLLGRANWWPRRLPAPRPSADLLPLPPAPAARDATTGQDGGTPPAGGRGGGEGGGRTTSLTRSGSGARRRATRVRGRGRTPAVAGRGSHLGSATGRRRLRRLN